MAFQFSPFINPAGCYPTGLSGLLPPLLFFNTHMRKILPPNIDIIFDVAKQLTKKISERNFEIMNRCTCLRFQRPMFAFS
jgi:hypothetical protein